MEGNQKNQISTFLMVVGVIFIVVAGSIFVTTAWQHLPETAKQVCLFLVTSGLFAGSHAVAKGGVLRKTETAFYYLGVVFTGFFTVSLFGGMEEAGMNEVKVLSASVMMMVPMLIRLFLKKKGVDFGINVILADTMLLSIAKAFGWSFWGYTLAFSVFVLLLSAFDYWREKKSSEHPDLDMAIEISYILHGMLCLLLVRMLSMVDDSVICLTALPVWILAAAAVITYAGRKQIAFRVINSVSIFWGIFATVNDVNRILELNKNGLSVLFAVFVIALVIMVCMDREEMYYMQLAAGTLVPFLQVLGMLCNWNAGNNEFFCLPFSITLAMACVTLWIKEREGSFLQMAGLQAAAGVIIQFFAFYTMDRGHMTFDEFGVVFFLLLTILFLVIAVEVPYTFVSRLFVTFALASGVVAAMFLSVGMVHIPTGYHTEWNCVAFGIGIVLLGRMRMAAYLIGNVGICFVGAFWYYFAELYTGRNIAGIRKYVPVTLSACHYLSVLTNEWHHLYYTEFTMEKVVHGPLFYSNVVVTYVFVIAGAVILYRYMGNDEVECNSDAAGEKRPAAKILVAASVLVPVIFNAIYLTGLVQPAFDITPLGFAISIFLVMLATVEYQFMDLTKELAITNEKLLLEQERNRIAQQVHDTAGHTLTMIQSYMKLAEVSVKNQETGKAEEYLADAKILTSQGIRELRESINQLRREAAYELVTQGIMQLADQMKEIPVEVTVQGEDSERYSHLSKVIYDTVRESITNTLKCAECSKMEVIVRFQENSVELVIGDDGKGCDSIQENNGIRGIRERIKNAGGTVRFLSSKDGGFLTRVKIPVR